MMFQHVPVHGNPPLVASYCLACLHVIAMSTREELLAVNEKIHQCAKKHKTTSTRKVSTRYQKMP